MTLRELLNQLQHQFDLHLKDEVIAHQAITNRLTESEEFQVKIEGWINWGLRIILGSLLAGFLVLLGLKT